MYLLYTDDSGSISDPNQPFFILAGIAVFERQVHWVEQELNKIASRFNANNHFAIEFHGSPMRSGKECWRGISPQDRLQAAKDVLAVCASNATIKIFASVIDKRKSNGFHIIERSFEQLSSRFDMFLTRKHRKSNTQRGLMILDKSTSEIQIQSLAREFKYSGHRWGTLNNFADVPLFVDSKATRLIQLADMVCFAIKRHFADGDDVLFDIIKNSFDSEGGVTHGLYTHI